MTVSDPPQHHDPLAETMRGIMQHPAFDVAVLHYLEHVLAWRRSMGLFNRVASNAGLHIIAYLLLLHYANATSTPEGGATFSRLLDMCERRKNCGSRALRTTLILCHAMGYLHSSRGARDRRIQIYEPSPKLLQQVRQQHVHAFACLDILVPGGRFAEAARSDPAFFPNLFATFGRACIDFDIRITEHFPALHELSELQGGYPTFLSIVDAQLRGHKIPSGQAIAKEFHISPSQVRTVLNAADASGLITLSDAGQAIETAPLVAQNKGMIARELALYAKYSLGLADYFGSFNRVVAGQMPQTAHP